MVVLLLFSSFFAYRYRDLRVACTLFGIQLRLCEVAVMKDSEQQLKSEVTPVCEQDLLTAFTYSSSLIISACKYFVKMILRVFLTAYRSARTETYTSSLQKKVNEDLLSIVETREQIFRIERAHSFMIDQQRIQISSLTSSGLFVAVRPTSSGSKNGILIGYSWTNYFKEKNPLGGYNGT